MMKTLMTAVMTSISEVMETMFFMPVEPGEETSFSRCGLDEDLLFCRLGFKGEASGSLTIAAPAALAQEMAENFMGESRDSLTGEQISGTLTEMLNMVCGNALSRMASKAPFELGIPEIINRKSVSDEALFTPVETPAHLMAVGLKMD